jgi:hypothetical protein
VGVASPLGQRGIYRKMTTRSIRDVTAVVCLLFGSSLATFAADARAYAGPALPRQQVAILKISGDLEVKSVDGRDKGTCEEKQLTVWRITTQVCPYFFASHSIELLPGNHTIRYSAYKIRLLGPNEASKGSKDEPISVEAGRTYKTKLGHGVFVDGRAQWWVTVVGQ